MRRFDTDDEAKEYVRKHVDVRVPESTRLLGNGAILHAFPWDLEEGTFTNIYDLSFPAGSLRPSIELHDRPTGVFNYAKTDPDIRAATGGGFFFLADQAETLPRQLALNMALIDNQMYSFPVVDRESVITSKEGISTEYIQSLGILGIGGAELSWSGSLTPHETDVKVFANGNCIITHVQNDATGNIRVLDETSHYTPPIDIDDTVDIGFIRRDDGVFAGVSASTTGGLDIFTHDVILRTPEQHIHERLPEMYLRTIGDKALDGAAFSALTAGPMLDTEDFTTHPINKDMSLGTKPPFLDVPLARSVLYETDDNMRHVRLFDGRPGSPVFPGVTPNQAAEFIKGEQAVTWGCFLDPGQTAKLVTRDGKNALASYGNTHYLKWPQQPGKKFIWMPKTGRPIASMITWR